MHKSTTVQGGASDRRVRELLGPGEPTVVSADASLDKAQAEAFLDDEKAKPPERRASVLLWNRKSGRAARALIGLAGGADGTGRRSISNPSLRYRDWR
jgi:hypothetical protein